MQKHPGQKHQISIEAFILEFILEEAGKVLLTEKKNFIFQCFAKGNESLLFFFIPLQMSKEFPFPEKKKTCVDAKQLFGDGLEPTDRISAS